MKLKIVPISSIIIKNRTRKEVGNTKNIQESSKTFAGQIQTIAVCESLEAEKYEVLDGGRRLEAFKAAGKTEIAVRIYPKTLTFLQRKEIELIGNTARLDFEWHEEIALKQEIHEIQKSIRESEQKENPKLKNWTQKDTADSLGVSTTALEADIKLASFIKLVPKAKEAKNKTDAISLETKVIEKLLKEELSNRINQRIAETGLEKIQQEIRDCYMIGDFFDCADRVIGNKFFDLVEIDPPYGISLDVKRTDRNDMAEVASREDFDNWNAGDKETYTQKILETLTICYSKLKENGWVIVWHDIAATGPMTLYAMEEASFTVDHVPAVWLKNVQGRNFNPTFRFGRRYEPFYVGYKGKPILAKTGQDNVFECPRESHANRIHPTEKPRALLKDIIQTFCQPGSKILSPFLGSGNVILSAYDSGCTCVGFDLGQSYKNSFDIRASEWEPLK